MPSLGVFVTLVCVFYFGGFPRLAVGRRSLDDKIMLGLSRLRVKRSL